MRDLEVRRRIPTVTERRRRLEATVVWALLALVVGLALAWLLR